MKYLSLCSGIEAATVAWESLGWEPTAFAEFDQFPSAVLAHHYPDVPNLGDISKIDGKKYRKVVQKGSKGEPERQKNCKNKTTKTSFRHRCPEKSPKW